MFFVLRGCCVFTAFQSCDPNELFVCFDYQAVIPKRFEHGLSAKNDGKSKFWVVPVVYQDPFCCEQNAFVFTRNLRCGVDAVLTGPQKFSISKNDDVYMKPEIQHFQGPSIFCWYLFARLRFFLFIHFAEVPKEKEQMDGACDATMKIKACSGEDNEMRKNTLLGDFLIHFYSHHKRSSYRIRCGW